jgi:ribosome biogenesis GTPase
MNALVLKTTGNNYTVRTVDGIVLECRLKGIFRKKDIKSTNPIVVGDNVRISKESDSWMIFELLERKNFIVRKSVNLSKQKHILAANIDQVILMITLDSPVTTTVFIDRFLVAANASNIEAVLLFNKVDVYDSILLKNKEKLEDIYQSAGYKTISISVLNDDLVLIQNIMKDKLNLISGHSGVGKSTLINRLQPDLNLNTTVVSESHNQGQHTTTFSQLYDLDFGGSIIDTPGIKGFGLVDVVVNDVANLFPEFVAVRNSCKYYNCIHKNEPECAVKLAVEDGSISKSRYTNYLNMIDEDQENIYRQEKY